MSFQKLKERVMYRPAPAHPGRLIFVMTAIFFVLGAAAGVLQPLFLKDLLKERVGVHVMALYGGGYGFIIEFLGLGPMFLPPILRWRVILMNALITLPLLLIFSVVWIQWVLAAFTKGFEALDHVLRWGCWMVAVALVSIALPSMYGWMRWATEEARNEKGAS